MAKDIVHHFLSRGDQGKAMVVSIDKLTTLRMVEKVRAEWEAEKSRVLKALEGMACGHPVWRIEPRINTDKHGFQKLAGNCSSALRGITPIAPF